MTNLELQIKPNQLTSYDVAEVLFWKIWTELHDWLIVSRKNRSGQMWSGVKGKEIKQSAKRLTKFSPS